MNGSVVMTSDEAAALGARLARAQLVAACPDLRRSGPLRAIAGSGDSGMRFIESTSQRQAMATLIGAAQAGARVFTAAASQSLAHAHEMMFWAAQARLPVVMANPSHPLGPGLNFGSDASDCAAQRDCGWVQIFCESAQEVLDSVILAYRVAYASSLPVMVSYDASTLSNSYEPVNAPEEGAVSAFVGAGEMSLVLGEGEPRSFGPETDSNSYAQFRRAMEEALDAARLAFDKAASDFAGKFGRGYASVEPVFTKGSDLALVASGSMAGTARAAVDRMRRRGELAGLIKMRMLRPFPRESLVDAVFARRGSPTIKRLAVLDRNAGHGADGVWSQEIRAALSDKDQAPRVICVRAGLGRRDVGAEEIERAYDEARASGDDLRTIWL